MNDADEGAAFSVLASARCVRPASSPALDEIAS
jgi:hypothetical protein